MSTAKCLFCGGRGCRYEDYRVWMRKPQGIAIEGLYSNWITESLLAMQRPSSALIRRHRLHQRFREVGIGAIINCQLPGEHALCGDGIVPDSGFSYSTSDWEPHGIRCYNFGWTDMTVPPLDVMFDVVHAIAAEVDLGHRVAVHCHAGLGRTGLTIACYLVYAKTHTADDAIELVRRRRPGSVQTRTQVAFVHHFESVLKESMTLFHGVPTTLPPETIAAVEALSPKSDVSATSSNLDQFYYKSAPQSTTQSPSQPHHQEEQQPTHHTLVPPPLRVWSISNYVDNQQLYLHGEERDRLANSSRLLEAISKRLYALGSQSFTNRLMITMAFETPESPEDYAIQVAHPNADTLSRSIAKSKNLKLSQAELIERQPVAYYRNNKDFYTILNCANCGDYSPIFKCKRVGVLVAVLLYFIASLKEPILTSENLKHIVKAIKYHRKHGDSTSTKAIVERSPSRDPMSRLRISNDGRSTVSQRSISAPTSPTRTNWFSASTGVSPKSRRREPPTIKDCVSKMVAHMHPSARSAIVLIMRSFYSVEQITPEVIANITRRLSSDRLGPREVSIDPPSSTNGGISGIVYGGLTSLIGDTPSSVLSRWRVYASSSWGISEMMLAGFSTDHSQFMDVEDVVEPANTTSNEDEEDDLFSSRPPSRATSVKDAPFINTTITKRPVSKLQTSVTAEKQDSKMGGSNIDANSSFVASCPPSEYVYSLGKADNPSEQFQEVVPDVQQVRDALQKVVYDQDSVILNEDQEVIPLPNDGGVGVLSAVTTNQRLHANTSSIVYVRGPSTPSSPMISRPSSRLSTSRSPNGSVRSSPVSSNFPHLPVTNEKTRTSINRPHKQGTLHNSIKSPIQNEITFVEDSQFVIPSEYLLQGVDNGPRIDDPEVISRGLDEDLANGSLLLDSEDEYVEAIKVENSTSSVPGWSQVLKFTKQVQASAQRIRESFTESTNLTTTMTKEPSKDAKSQLLSRMTEVISKNLPRSNTEPVNMIADGNAEDDEEYEGDYSTMILPSFSPSGNVFVAGRSYDRVTSSGGSVRSTFNILPDDVLAKNELSIDKSNNVVTVRDKTPSPPRQNGYNGNSSDFPAVRLFKGEVSPKVNNYLRNSSSDNSSGNNNGGTSNATKSRPPLANIIKVVEDKPNIVPTDNNTSEVGNESIIVVDETREITTALAAELAVREIMKRHVF